MSEQHLLQSIQTGQQARSEARPVRTPDAGTPNMRRAVVTAINANGTYEVELYGPGGPVLTIPAAFAWGASLDVGDKVAASWDPPSPIPWLMPSGSGGGGGASVEWFGTDKLGFAQTG